MPAEAGNELRARLAGTRFGDVRWVAETGSTNDDARALARAGSPEGVVLVADHQTAGRGRLGRAWQAPVGASLLTTVLLRPPAGSAEAAVVAAALAMAEAVERVTGGRVPPRLKWPNDLTVDDRKLAGILSEAEWTGGDAAVCVGIGVNCNWPDEVPAELASTLTAINHLTGEPVDRADLLVEFLHGLERRYAALDPEALRSEWRERAATLGRRVRVELGTETVEGVAVDVSPAGHLLVEVDGGATRSFAVGDVTHLRHA